jgi:serine/threonine protein kinase
MGHKFYRMLRIDVPGESCVGSSSSCLDDYAVFGIIEEGKFGTVVYKCMNRSKGTMLAIKIISKSSTSLSSIKQEIDLLKSVIHPNIIQMEDCFEDHSHVHIITELCTGGDLFNFMQDNITDSGCLQEKLAIPIVRTLLKTVQYLHDQNDIVHRDIKPENVLLCKSRPRLNEQDIQLKLADFGLAVRHRLDDAKMEERVGSSYYMSPDILNGSYDRSCDVYSVGVISYILLCGYPPFTGSNDRALHKAIKKRFVYFKRAVWSKFSETSKDFIRELLCIGGREGIVTATEALGHPWMKE